PASVVLVGGGKVLGVGGPELLARAKPSATVRDLAGAAVVPGLRDAHGHLASYGRRLLDRECDLSTSADQDDAGQMIKAWVQRHRPKPGEWIVARGWDESRWESWRPPSAEDLKKAEKEGHKFEN